jgi:hypothetical protein
MSYGNKDGYGKLPPLQESQQKRPRGCNPIALLLIGVGVYILFNTMGPKPNAGPGENEWNQPAEQPDRSATDQQSIGTKRANGDWDMQELDAVEPEQPKSKPDSKRNKKTEKGDWAMEEVGSTDTPGGGNNSNTKTNNPSAKPQSKKTKKGDWEMEEVGGG